MFCNSNLALKPVKDLLGKAERKKDFVACKVFWALSLCDVTKRTASSEVSDHTPRHDLAPPSLSLFLNTWNSQHSVSSGRKLNFSVLDEGNKQRAN